MSCGGHCKLTLFIILFYYDNMNKRKSFVFFTSWASALSAYSPEVRCAIYDAIISYVDTGEEPDFNDDPVTAASFRFIKQDIDLMKHRYDDTCKRRKEAIKKRWQKYHEKKAADNASAAEPMQENTNNTNVPFVFNTIQDDTKNTIVSNEYKKYKPIHYVYDNVDGNDNEDDNEYDDVDGNDNNNDLSTSSIKDNINNINNINNISNINTLKGNNISRASAKNDVVGDDLINQFFADTNQAQIESLAMQLRCTPLELRAMAEETIDQWQLEQIHHDNYQDAARHLTSTMRIKARAKKTAKTKSALGPGEFINDKGQRTYGTGRVILPETAPTRPTERHAWDASSQTWELM